MGNGPTEEVLAAVWAALRAGGAWLPTPSFPSRSRDVSWVLEIEGDLCLLPRQEEVEGDFGPFQLGPLNKI